MTTPDLPFASPYRHDFVRVAAAVPHVRLGDPRVNAEHTVELARQAHDDDAAVVVFPELGLAGYSDRGPVPPGRPAARRPRRARRRARRVGRPAPGAGRRRAAPGRAPAVQRRAVVHRGQVLGVVPKSYLPELPRVLREAPVPRRPSRRSPITIELLGDAVPVRHRPAVRRRGPARLRARTSRSARTSGSRSRRAPTARWPARPCSPTCRRSNITIGKADYRRTAVLGAVGAHDLAPTSTRRAGLGESTTDLAWDGQAMISENGDLLAESERFADEAALIDRRRRPRPAGRRPGADDELRRLRSTTTATRADVPARRRSTLEPPVARGGRCGARSSASRTSPPTRPNAPSAARRSTTSRSAASRRGCARPGSRRS